MIVCHLMGRLQSKLVICCVYNSMQKLRKELIQQKYRLEDQLAIVQMQEENDQRSKQRPI
jgi:tRNA uridine 5-carbamoylmethylation protein Kti12